MTFDDDFYRKREKLKLLEQRKRLKSELPHLYGFNFFQWQLDYINSANRYNFLKAANQIGKSICNFTKLVTIATDPKCWDKYFQ